MDEKVYAPMLIPTLCRDQHFMRCIESLKRNTWAKYTDVYIGLDYPPDEKYRDGYIKICEYLKSNDFSQFASFNVCKRNVNFGSVKNMAALRDSVETKFPYFIRTDDDAEFSPDFLEYINKALWHYKDDNRVLGIMGFSYPLKWDVKNNCNVFKLNCMCYMWGTAFYFDRYNRVKNDLENQFIKNNFSQFVKEKRYKKLLDVRFEEFICEGIFEHQLLETASDVGIGTYMPLKKNVCMIAPTISKVRNWGYDGTGLYCPNITEHSGKMTSLNFDYVNQEIDSSVEFTAIFDEDEKFDANRKILNEFEIRDKKILFRSYLKLLIYKAFGLKIFQIYKKKKHKFD